MDGVDDWTCSAWSDCLGGKEVVFCNGNYGHNYPFYDERPRFIAGFRIGIQLRRRWIADDLRS